MKFSNKKWLLVLPLYTLLVGCPFTKTVTETVYSYQYPPDYLTEECYPDKPAEATIGEVIQIQSAALDQCNNQLSALRFWKQEETQE